MLALCSIPTGLQLRCCLTAVCACCVYRLVGTQVQRSRKNQTMMNSTKVKYRGCIQVTHWQPSGAQPRPGILEVRGSASATTSPTWYQGHRVESLALAIALHGSVHTRCVHASRYGCSKKMAQMCECVATVAFGATHKSNIAWSWPSPAQANNCVKRIMDQTKQSTEVMLSASTGDGLKCEDTRFTPAKASASVLRILSLIFLEEKNARQGGHTVRALPNACNVHRHGPSNQSSNSGERMRRKE